MAEFGVQLRKAREAKGMTQQSLAEEVYVTRQTVSRWESGERYPDLVTVKKLTQVLGVDAGYLISDDESQRIVERSPIIGKSAVNTATLVLYAGIVVSYLISIVGTIIRIPSWNISASVADVWVIGGNAAACLIAVVAFACGFSWILKGWFSPKRVGAVMMAFFASNCIKEVAILTTKAEVGSWVVAILMIAASLAGLIACYSYFWKKRASKVCYYVIEAVSALGIVGTLYSVATTAVYAAKYTSADNAVNAVLMICVYVLFGYQTYVLNKRRKMADSK